MGQFNEGIEMDISPPFSSRGKDLMGVQGGTSPVTVRPISYFEVVVFFLM